MEPILFITLYASQIGEGTQSPFSLRDLYESAHRDAEQKTDNYSRGGSIH